MAAFSPQHYAITSTSSRPKTLGVAGLDGLAEIELKRQHESNAEAQGQRGDDVLQIIFRTPIIFLIVFNQIAFYESWFWLRLSTLTR